MVYVMSKASKQSKIWLIAETEDEWYTAILERTLNFT